MTQKSVNNLAYKIVGCAIEVHRQLGPGLLESIYEECLICELENQSLNVLRQVEVPIFYKERKLGNSLKLDLLVNDTVIIELKAVETIIPVFKAQLLSYMKLAKKPKGLLINFHTDNITRSVVPLVNEYFSRLPNS